MAVLNRGVQIVWDDTDTGSNGSSKWAVVGAQTNVAAHISVDSATTIGFEVAYAKNRSAGRNAEPSEVDAHVFYKSDGSGPLTITLSSAGAVTIDLSSFTPNFIRLTSTADVTATAAIEVVG